jgi:hypothetical protein
MSANPRRIHVEPWPAGGWVVRLEGHPVPISQHDTENEAKFKADACRRAVMRGQRLASVDETPSQSVESVGVGAPKPTVRGSRPCDEPGEVGRG